MDKKQRRSIGKRLYSEKWNNSKNNKQTFKQDAQVETDYNKQWEFEITKIEIQNNIDMEKEVMSMLVLIVVVMLMNIDMKIDMVSMFIAYNLRRIINIIDHDVFKKFLQELAFLFLKINTSVKAFGFKIANLIFRYTLCQSIFNPPL